MKAEQFFSNQWANYISLAYSGLEPLSTILPLIISEIQTLSTIVAKLLITCVMLLE